MDAQHWYTPVKGHKSLGSTANRPGSLAGLHQARAEHLSQFFTPEKVAALVWRLLSPIMAQARADHPHAKISLFDSAIGSGRLIQFADPEQHRIYGTDIHQESVEVLTEAMASAGFDAEIIRSGMEDIHPHSLDIGLINPPFSIHLESPNLSPYPCTTWGRFGRNTNAVSHAYALHQAIDACQLVAAILPTSYAQETLQDEALAGSILAVIRLPRGAFREENTDVDTSVVIASRYAVAGRKPVIASLGSFDEPLPALDFMLLPGARAPKLGHVDGYTDEGPTIHLPVTGDNRVRVSHDGRRIRLKFSCGLTQAKVANHVLGGSVRRYAPPDHRYPRGVRFTGQGKLDIETHLAQQDPLASFRALIREIEKAGGLPVVDMGLARFIRRRAKENQRRSTPFRHTVKLPFVAGSDTVEAKARKTHLAVANVWGAPVIKMGVTVAFRRTEGGMFEYEAGGCTFSINQDELHKRFIVEESMASAGDQWAVIHEGRNVAFPEISKAMHQKTKRLGLDKWLSWLFQLDDLTELFIAPGDAIVAWEMGLGKARLALALVLMSECKHGLIAVESQLVDEMVKELNGLGIPADQWQVIDGPGKLRELKQLNIISYERLRMPIDRRHARRTYAAMLRRRIGTLVADEGHLLRKPDTDQTKALWMVSARRKYILTGTPAANYPRDVHPLLVFEGGDGTAVQPYGWHRGYLEANQRQSMSHAMRGVDAFRENFVVTEWCTNEFKEDNTNGAKREVPKIANLDAYRKAIACHVKRRVAHEPEVAKWITIPVPNKKVTTIEWDHDHLAHYLKVADEFAGWYRQQAEKAGDKGIKVNLIALLARIQAVEFACNFPQRGVKGFGAYGPLTSKQRYALDRIAELVAEGRKIILYAENPGVLDLLHRHLAANGIRSLIFHGGLNIKKRTRALDAEFRYGDTPVLLASLGVTQTGLNIPQANYVIYYDRAWDATTENQAGARVLRPQQINEVDFEYLHLQGGIDTYQAQMVAHKGDSIAAGLDWATPELAGVEFLHLDTLLGRFCKDLSEQMGVKPGQLREALAA